MKAVERVFCFLSSGGGDDKYPGLLLYRMYLPLQNPSGRSNLQPGTSPLLITSPPNPHPHTSVPPPTPTTQSERLRYIPLPNNHNSSINAILAQQSPPRPHRPLSPTPPSRNPEPIHPATRTLPPCPRRHNRLRPAMLLPYRALGWPRQHHADGCERDAQDRGS